METALLASEQILKDYFDLFVNRGAFTIQRATPGAKKRGCCYFRPKGRVPLSPLILRKHLQGNVTIGLYAINPGTQRCKWVAIDADYARALDDLLKLQWELRQEGIESAIERSRRGGHLWIFAAEPLLARDCRVYVHEIARRLQVPVKGSVATTGGECPSRIGETKQTLSEGIEVFPKQDQIAADEFGNAIRAPLGVHLGAGKRYWFYGADYSLEAQMEFLKALKKITPEQLSSFVQKIKKPILQQPETQNKRARAGDSLRPYDSRAFSILNELRGKLRRAGRNYFTQCPSCASQGRDRHGDNLAISIAESSKYCCWAGCTKEQIRAALGRPVRDVSDRKSRQNA